MHGVGRLASGLPASESTSDTGSSGDNSVARDTEDRATETATAIQSEFDSHGPMGIAAEIGVLLSEPAGVCRGINVLGLFPSPFATNYPFGLHAAGNSCISLSFDVRSTGRARGNGCTGEISGSSSACEDRTRIPFETTFKAIATRAALLHTDVSIMSRNAWDNEFSGPAAYV